jgi:hypothetical protein
MTDIPRERSGTDSAHAVPVDIGLVRRDGDAYDVEIVDYH